MTAPDLVFTDNNVTRDSPRQIGIPRGSMTTIIVMLRQRDREGGTL